MSRLIPAALAGLILFAAGPARAAEPPAGTWKMSLQRGNLVVLFTLEQKNGKWTGQFLDANLPRFPKATVADVTVTPDSLRLTFKIQTEDLTFDGRMPAQKDGSINGTALAGPGRLFIARLRPSKMKSYDRYEAAREELEQTTEPEAVADAAVELLKGAGEKKAKIEEVRGWADKAFKSADQYGTRWQRLVSTKLAQALGGQKDFAPLAVEYARKAERLLDESEAAETQVEILDALVEVLGKAGKADDAKELLARLTKLEEKDLAEHAKKAPFKADRFDGRKGKSDRVVLVELFTGSECEPCVAADLAFNALEKSYKPSEVVLLQYHVHIPNPDPLTNPDTNARLQYYDTKVGGTPTILFNGSPGPKGGGPAAAAKKKYTEYRDLVEPLLEKLPDAKIQLTATKKGSAIEIKASVPDVAKPGENVRLRLALVEDHVRYEGGNGQKYHHCVARAFPGGPRGLAVSKKGVEQTATVNIDDLRNKLTDYLDEYGKSGQEREFFRPDRPMALRKLRIVAFVQDDSSNEVLNAAQVEVKD